MRRLPKRALLAVMVGCVLLAVAGFAVAAPPWVEVDPRKSLSDTPISPGDSQGLIEIHGIPRVSLGSAIPGNSSESAAGQAPGVGAPLPTFSVPSPLTEWGVDGNIQYMKALAQEQTAYRRGAYELEVRSQQTYRDWIEKIITSKSAQGDLAMLFARMLGLAGIVLVSLDTLWMFFTCFPRFHQAMKAVGGPESLPVQIEIGPVKISNASVGVVVIAIAVWLMNTIATDALIIK
jgi:hypothetical protein